MMAGVAYSEDSKEQVLFPQQDMLKETFYIYKDSDDNSMKSANIASYKGKKIGYLEHYMPYSDTDEEGKVTGLIADIISDLFAALPGQAYKPELVYKGFSSHEEMIEALKQGEVDVVFPVGGQIPYAEKMRYQQSSCVVQSGMDLVYADGDGRL